LKVQGENAFTNNIWVKVVKNGKAEYRHVARYEENDDGFTYIRIPVASIYDDPTSSTEKDSVQVLAAFRVKTFVLDEERQIREQLDYNNFGFDSSVPYDTLLLAQIFESVPYTNGSVPSDFYYIDMIKVGGYVSENDNYY
jgi:hypothetical protein